MSTELQERARKCLEQAAQKVQQLQEKACQIADALAIAKQEEEGWRDFILKAEQLEKMAKDGSADEALPRSICVQKDSHAARAAAILLREGKRMSLKALAKELFPGQEDDQATRNNLNSAMWRRDDIFDKTNEGYGLVTKDFTIV